MHPYRVQYAKQSRNSSGGYGDGGGESSTFRAYVCAFYCAGIFSDGGDKESNGTCRRCGDSCVIGGWTGREGYAESGCGR